MTFTKWSVGGHQQHRRYKVSRLSRLSDSSLKFLGFLSKIEAALQQTREHTDHQYQLDTCNDNNTQRTHGYLFIFNFSRKCCLRSRIRQRETPFLPAEGRRTLLPRSLPPSCCNYNSFISHHNDNDIFCIMLHNKKYIKLQDTSFREDIYICLYIYIIF